eukprot:25476-Amphidinium_carterae.1
MMGPGKRTCCHDGLAWCAVAAQGSITRSSIAREQCAHNEQLHRAIFASSGVYIACMCVSTRVARVEAISNQPSSVSRGACAPQHGQNLQCLTEKCSHSNSLAATTPALGTRVCGRVLGGSLQSADMV